MGYQKTEYRVVYRRSDSESLLYRDGFPKKDINWRAYFHRIHPYQVVRWEERTVTSSDWRPSNG